MSYATIYDKLPQGNYWFLTVVLAQSGSAVGCQ